MFTRFVALRRVQRYEIKATSPVTFFHNVKSSDSPAGTPKNATIHELGLKSL